MCTTMIRHAENEYSSLIHLVPGSIEVATGDRVTRGEQIGQCGHSGNSAEPHLHFQVQDHPTFEISTGLPVRFDDLDVDMPGTDVVEETSWTEPDGSGRYIHVGQRVSHTTDSEPDRIEERSVRAEVPTASGLSPIRMFGRVATGLSIGGFVTILTGIVVSSLQTIALALAGLAGLGLVYQVWRHVVEGDRVRFDSVGTICGVGVAAALVGGFVALDALPELASSGFGTGLFVTGFILYIAVWEYGQREPFRVIEGVTDR